MSNWKVIKSAQWRNIAGIQVMATLETKETSEGEKSRFCKHVGGELTQLLHCDAEIIFEQVARVATKLPTFTE